MERSFADASNLHGFKRARWRRAPMPCVALAFRPRVPFDQEEEQSFLILSPSGEPINQLLHSLLTHV